MVQISIASILFQQEVVFQSIKLQYLLINLVTHRITFSKDQLQSQ